MNKTLLDKHIAKFIRKLKNHETKSDADYEYRKKEIEYYGSFIPEKIKAMSEDDFVAYFSRLWAMLIWGNKKYYIDKLIADNGFDKIKTSLIDLLWSKESIELRWDKFRKDIKGMGPAMISEMLCKTHPVDFMLWNRRAYVAYDYLEVPKLPRYDYQFTGKMYDRLCSITKDIAHAMSEAGVEDTSLLAVDYFIWDELQVVDNLSTMHKHEKEVEHEEIEVLNDKKNIEFIHNEVRDKISNIGDWLGFKSKTEQKVAEGSRVDVYWESTIGNMGRVIYVFEVQTGGSIDSLLMNLLKSLNNPAVQGIVAVSDEQQLTKIKSQAQHIPTLRDKLKYWNYEEVLQVHESLAFVNSSINNLNLVPQGF